MEQIKKSVEKDDAATHKEEVKRVRKKKETKDDATSTSSLCNISALCPAVDPHAAPTPPQKEERQEVQEKKQQHPSKEPPGTSPKIPPQDTFTAWEKKPSSKEGKRAHPPRFSRLLNSLSEEHLVSEQESEVALEPPKEELENLVFPRASLHEHLTGQENGIPVNFSTPSLHHPEQIPAVETVETVESKPKMVERVESKPKTVEMVESKPMMVEKVESKPKMVETVESKPKMVEMEETKPKTLENEVPSTSKEAEKLPDQSARSDIELKKEDSTISYRRDATVRSVHSKLLLQEDSGSSSASIPETFPSIWNMGQRASHWKLAHQRGYHIDQITQDKVLKSLIMKHERDTKASVPLPLQEVIEEEVLEILKETLKAYHKLLGVNHHLTIQMEERAEKLHLRLKGRGVID